jgi:hypothetical protein
MLPTKFRFIWPNGFREKKNITHFVPIHEQTWPPQAILVSDWLLFKKNFSSETAWQNGAKLGRKQLCKILYKASSFGSKNYEKRKITPRRVIRFTSKLQGM